jgi:hypothetical protein
MVLQLCWEVFDARQILSKVLYRKKKLMVLELSWEVLDARSIF